MHFPRLFTRPESWSLHRADCHELKEKDLHQTMISLWVLTVVTHYFARNLPWNTKQQIQQQKDQSCSPERGKVCFLVIWAKFSSFRRVTLNCIIWNMCCISATHLYMDDFHIGHMTHGLLCIFLFCVKWTNFLWFACLVHFLGPDIF